MAPDHQGQVVVTEQAPRPLLREHPAAIAALAAVRSGRAFAIGLTLCVLVFMVALVAVGGDTVQLTQSVTVSQAAIDVMALLSENILVLLVIVALGLLALAAGVSAVDDWWSRRPRLGGAAVPVRGAPAAPGEEPAVLRRGLTGLGKALAFAGLALLLLALAVSSRTRGAQTVLLGEGVLAGVPVPGPSSYRWQVDRTTPADIAVIGPDEALRADEIDLALDENLEKLDGPGALSTAARATVTLAGPSGEAVATVTPWPGTDLAGRDAYLSTVGLAPRVAVTDRKGRVVIDSMIVATLLPKGALTEISLAPAPLTMDLTALRALGPLRATRAPIVYGATLKDAKGDILTRKRLDPGQTIEARGYRVSIPGTSAWARVTLVRDPAASWVFAAARLLLFSLLVAAVARVWPRLELAPESDEEGSMRLVRPRWTYAPLATRMHARHAPPQDGGEQ